MPNLSQIKRQRMLDFLETLRKELAEEREKLNTQMSLWENEKQSVEKPAKIRDEIEEVKGKIDIATPEGKYDEVGKLQYEVLPGLLKELERLETIPEGSSELFRLFVRTGMNVLFAGPVRSGKTTFLQIWQSYEDPKLEGAAIATDPETDW